MPGERLTQRDRHQIAAGLKDGQTYAAIARRLGRPTSTVTREVMRNGGPGAYRALPAQRDSKKPGRQHDSAPPKPLVARVEVGGRDPRVVAAVAAQTAELIVQAGIPQMMARVLAALFTTDSGSLSSADLVRRLRVSPASISKAVAYLENQELIRRERDPHRRAERYVIDNDVFFRAMMASAHINDRIATACKHGAGKLGVATPAGARLDNISHFLRRVSEDLIRSAEHWHRVYFSPPDGHTPE